MLYDGHINCGADILSEDTSDKRDKYKDYEENCNDEDLQRSVGSEELENDTTESSQNSYPDVLDDWYSELEALTEAADVRKLKRNGRSGGSMRGRLSHRRVRTRKRGQCSS